MEKEKKYYGFPRQSGDCKVHDISSFEFEVKGYYPFEDSRDEDEDDDGEAILNIEELIEWTDDALTMILDRLYELN